MGSRESMSPFALSIMQQKYAHTIGGRKESWQEIAHRVATNVMSVAPVSRELTREIERVIAERKFIPGGRYLYAAGRPLHQTQNCLLCRADDSREGWADLLHKCSMGLMTGAGIGVDYSAVRPRGQIIQKTGGVASGPLALMQMVNEAGRHIRQGGARRSALWAGLNWAHDDAFDFVRIKDWSSDVRALKERDFDFPATLDGTNISISLDDEFFRAYQDASHPLHSRAYDIYWTTVKRMLKTAEPGFAIDVGANAGETLRNACVAGDTTVLTRDGYQPIASILGKQVEVWNGVEWSHVQAKVTGHDLPMVAVMLSDNTTLRCTQYHTFVLEDDTRVPAIALTPGTRLMPTIYPDGSGRSFVVNAVLPAGHETAVFCFNEPQRHQGCFDGVVTGQCTEVTSYDDSDICNLGSLNLARIESIEELRGIVELATVFLLAGTLYSDVPYEKVAEVRTKNRRLGLGLMGVHEWLLQRGKRYGPDEEFAKWLAVYAGSTDAARDWASSWNISAPVKTRAVAPTGCQVGTTLVVTEDGILSLDELGNVKGQQWQPLNVAVAQERGDERLATRFFINGRAKTKRITLSSGVVLEATPNHQYRALTEEGKYVWKRTDELLPGDKLVVALGTYRKTVDTPLVPVPRHYRTERCDVNLPATLTPDLAEFLGLFFADGSMHVKGIRIACNAKEPEHAHYVGQLGRKIFGIEPTFEDNGRNCLSVCFASSQLLRWLYTNSLNKGECATLELPAVIRTMSRQAMERFIAGYWSGDGSASNTGTLYIATASQTLAQQLATMIRACGSDISIAQNISGFGSTMYRVRWIKTKRRDETKAISRFLDINGLEHCTVDTVTSISDSESLTYDIEVPETVTYIANGIVSHNTIGIIAETTTGIEPIFCIAYKRRYKDGELSAYQYVVDPTAQRLIDDGVPADMIEDAYDLAESIERRVAFQAWLGQFVDHALSSTVNLPAWGSELNNEDTVEDFGQMLFKYLPLLRGITCYPDGARGGQPLNRVSFDEAASQVGQVYYEGVDICDISKGGTCGA